MSGGRGGRGGRTDGLPAPVVDEHELRVAALHEAVAPPDARRGVLERGHEAELDLGELEVLAARETGSRNECKARTRPPPMGIV